PTDAEVRKDFPGGWKEDAVNKFTNEGRTTQEQEAWNYVSALASYRKTSSAITNGKMMQYLPKEGLYVYFRYNDKQTIMVISNTGNKSFKPDRDRFNERTNGFKTLKNVITGETKLFSDFE